MASSSSSVTASGPVGALGEGDSELKNSPTKSSVETIKTQVAGTQIEEKEHSDLTTKDDVEHEYVFVPLCRKPGMYCLLKQSSEEDNRVFQIPRLLDSASAN